MTKFKSRKFGLTIIALSLASIFLYFGKIGGGEWVTITTLALGMYKTANVMENKNG